MDSHLPRLARASGSSPALRLDRRSTPLVALLASIVLTGAAEAADAAQAPRTKPPAPAATAPAQQTKLPAPQAPGGSIAACDYITPDEAKGVLGPDVTPSTAPSKGLFTSCGYTSPAGDAITISVSDYGLPSVAQQFFDKTRELLKMATNEETIGVPAFSYLTAGAGGTSPAGGSPSSPTAAAPPATAAAPTVQAGSAAKAAGAQSTQARPDAPGAVGGAGAAGAPGGTGATPMPVAPSFNVMTMLALKDQRTVTLEASGPVAGLPQQLPKLRAILTRMLGTLPAPPPPEPPR